jgi:hypothetical protein
MTSAHDLRIVQLGLASLLWKGNRDEAEKTVQKSTGTRIYVRVVVECCAAIERPNHMQQSNWH